MVVLVRSSMADTSGAAVQIHTCQMNEAAYQAQEAIALNAVLPTHQLDVAINVVPVALVLAV